MPRFKRNRNGKVLISSVLQSEQGIQNYARKRLLRLKNRNKMTCLSWQDMSQPHRASREGKASFKGRSQPNIDSGVSATFSWNVTGQRLKPKVLSRIKTLLLMHSIEPSVSCTQVVPLVSREYSRQTRVPFPSCGRDEKRG